jgi:hypothetical protein
MRIAAADDCGGLAYPWSGVGAVSDSIQEKKQIQPTVEFKIGSETGQYPSRLSLARLIGAPFNVSLSGPNAKLGACGPGVPKTRAGLGKA